MVLGLGRTDASRADTTPRRLPGCGKCAGRDAVYRRLVAIMTQKGRFAEYGPPPPVVEALGVGQRLYSIASRTKS